MFNIGYFKAQPTEWVRQYVGGRLVKEGRGLSFYYLRHRTSIVVVPTSSQDASFVFNEQTLNYQAVAVQGQLTYRIADPATTAQLLDFSYDARRRTHMTEDPGKLVARLTNVVQGETRRRVQQMPLEAVLRDAAGIAAGVRAGIADAGLLAPMGVELLSLLFTSAAPKPEVGKALEAEYREGLLRRADEAIYARRAAAVEEEGKIRNNELASQISLEQERERLIRLEGENAQAEAEYRGKALELESGYRARATATELGAYREMEPRKLLALAMRDMGRNADRVGSLNVTTDVLAELLHDRHADA